MKLGRTVERKLASAQYQGHMIFNGTNAGATRKSLDLAEMQDSDLVAIKMTPKEVVLDKPVYAGMAILDL